MEARKLSDQELTHLNREYKKCKDKVVRELIRREINREVYRRIAEKIEKIRPNKTRKMCNQDFFAPEILIKKKNIDS